MFLVIQPTDIKRINDLRKPVTDEEDEMYGADEVGDTGIYAWDIANELVLGIHGAGYDFYDAHWSKLYDALGYQWHI